MNKIRHIDQASLVTNAVYEGRAEVVADNLQKETDSSSQSLYLLPFGEAFGRFMLDSGEGVFAGFQQNFPAFGAPSVHDIAVADVQFPEPLEYFDAFFVGRDGGRNGEIIRLPDPFQDARSSDKQVPGVFDRIQELLQGLDEQIVLLGGEVGAKDE